MIGSRKVKDQWLGYLIIGILVFLVVGIATKMTKMNTKSFNSTSKIIFVIKSEVANVRKRPSTDSEIGFKMKFGDVVTIEEARDEWFYIHHNRLKKKGWAHKVTMGRYLNIEYYDDLTLGKSVLELVW